jgi:hypothetical protein
VRSIVSSTARHRREKRDLARARDFPLMVYVLMIDRHANDFGPDEGVAVFLAALPEKTRSCATVVTSSGRSISSSAFPIRSRTQAK